VVCFVFEVSARYKAGFSVELRDGVKPLLEVALMRYQSVSHIDPIMFGGYSTLFTSSHWHIQFTLGFSILARNPEFVSLQVL
jgi:hypothetical protein